MSLPDLRAQFRTTTVQGTPAEMKELVESYLVRVCDVLNIEKRAPDQWEATEVFAALGALQAGLYRLAATHVELAMAPPEERVEALRGPSNGVTRKQLEHAIQCQRERPPMQDA